MGTVLAAQPVSHTSRSSGAWFPGDPVGRRSFAPLGALKLESGLGLDVTMAYETWGELNEEKSNAVLVLHALTGDSHVCGDAEPGHPTPGWWPQLVGEGRAIDPSTHFIVAPNILGGCQGTTGPASPDPLGRPLGSRFPFITTRDQVAAERRLMEILGIESWSLVIGGSMGGMRAIEWAVTYPERVRSLALIATTARVRADVIAFNSAQLAAIETSPSYRGGDYYHLCAHDGPGAALGVARRIAHTTYRTAEELEDRFSNALHPTARGEEVRHAVTSYLDHHAAKLERRFDAGSYVRLVKAMNTHDVGRGRGSVRDALARVTARTLVVAVDTDRLFPPDVVRELAEGIAGAKWLLLHSRVGHDGFLVESEELDRALRSFIAGQEEGTRSG